MRTHAVRKHGCKGDRSHTGICTRSSTSSRSKCFNTTKRKTIAGPALAAVKKVTKFVCCYLPHGCSKLGLQQSSTSYRHMISLLRAAMHHVYTNSMCTHAPLGIGYIAAGLAIIWPRACREALLECSRVRVHQMCVTMWICIKPMWKNGNAYGYTEWKGNRIRMEMRMPRMEEQLIEWK